MNAETIARQVLVGILSAVALAVLVRQVPALRRLVAPDCSCGQSRP